MTVDLLISEIDAGNIPPQKNFRCLLHEPNLKIRVEGCHRVLRSALMQGSPEARPLSFIFAQRCWELSGYSEHVLAEVVKAFENAGRIDLIRKCYKQIGLRFANDGNITKALYFFELWQNTNASFENLDRFEYDREVVRAIESMAKPFQHFPESTWRPPFDRPISVGYLIRNITDVGSVLVKLQHLLIENRDRTKFDVFVCIPEDQKTVLATEAGRENVRRFEAAGVRAVYLESDLGADQSLIQFASRIAGEKPDILFTSAAMATMRHFFVCCLRPAPLIVAQLQGPHAQFVSPSFDHAIAWLPQLVGDCPTNCDQVELNLELPESKPGNRSDILKKFDLPEAAKFIFIGGRAQKFQNRDFWRSINKVLTENKNAFLLISGIERLAVSFLDQVVDPENEKRIRFFGWQKDYVQYLGLADLAIDTYPSGGGVLIFEVMALGIPLIGFENDEIQIFDQVNWSAINGHMKNDHYILPREDWEKFVQVCREILTDPREALAVASQNRDHIKSKTGQPARMTKDIENIFERLVRERSSTWTRPNSADVRIADGQLLLEIAYRQQRLEGLIESTRTYAIGERERESEARSRSLSAEQAKLEEHVKYCAVKERELGAAWRELNLRYSERDAAIDNLTLWNIVFLFLRKIKRTIY